MPVGGVTVRLSTDPSVSGAAPAAEIDAAELAELTGGLSAAQIREALAQAAAIADASPTPGAYHGPAPTGPAGPTTELATSVMYDMYVPLDGAAVLAMTSRSLRSLDSSIRQRMSAISDRTATSNALTNKLAQLQEVRRVMDGDDKVRPDTPVTIDGEVTTVGEFMESIGKPIEGSRLNDTELDAVVAQVNQDLAKVSAGSEMTMIQLRQDVAQRAQILTLGSNMVSKFNQTLDQIASQVGR